MMTYEEAHLFECERFGGWAPREVSLKKISSFCKVSDIPLKESDVYYFQSADMDSSKVFKFALISRQAISREIEVYLYNVTENRLISDFSIENQLALIASGMNVANVTFGTYLKYSKGGSTGTYIRCRALLYLMVKYKIPFAQVDYRSMDFSKAIYSLKDNSSLTQYALIPDDQTHWRITCGNETLTIIGCKGHGSPKWVCSVGGDRAYNRFAIIRDEGHREVLFDTSRKVDNMGALDDKLKEVFQNFLKQINLVGSESLEFNVTTENVLRMLGETGQHNEKPKDKIEWTTGTTKPLSFENRLVGIQEVGPWAIIDKALEVLLGIPLVDLEEQLANRNFSVFEERLELFEVVIEPMFKYYIHPGLTHVCKTKIEKIMHTYHLWRNLQVGLSDLSNSHPQQQIAPQYQRQFPMNVRW